MRVGRHLYSCNPQCSNGTLSIRRLCNKQKENSMARYVMMPVSESVSPFLISATHRSQVVRLGPHGILMGAVLGDAELSTNYYCVTLLQHRDFTVNALISIFATRIYKIGHVYPGNGGVTALHAATEVQSEWCIPPIRKRCRRSDPLRCSLLLSPSLPPSS